MARKLTDELISRIVARHRAGLSYEQLADEFGLSRGSIGNAIKAAGKVPSANPSSPVATEPAPGASPPTAIEGESAELSELDAGDLRRMLTALIRTLDALAKEAHARGDGAVFARMAKTAESLIAQLRRLTPPEPPDHDNAPDMVAAAKRARELILERVRRRTQGNAA